MSTLAQHPIEEQLTRWAQAQYGADARVVDVGPMPGNAGLSYGFTVESEETSERLVIRLAPPGVQRRGNTDVLRQVPLLNVMKNAGIPTAAVRWSTDDPRWFGTDVFVQEFVSGAPLHLHKAHLSIKVGKDGIEPLLRRSVQTLVQIHALDWQSDLPDWEKPRDLAADVNFWRGLQAKAAEPPMGDLAERLAEELLASIPTQIQVGIFHGDFHTSNIMFDEHGEITAVVDWEISGIGAQLLDLGWLSIFTDPECWAPDQQQRMLVKVDPEFLRSEYEAAAGKPATDFLWYKAYACYRFSVIAAFNLRLHRTGRRVDHHYEELAQSVFTLLNKGRDLLTEHAVHQRK